MDLIRRITYKENGGVAIMAGVAIPVLLLFLVFILDLALWQTARANLQTAADAGSLAGTMFCHNEELYYDEATLDHDPGAEFATMEIYVMYDEDAPRRRAENVVQQNVNSSRIITELTEENYEYRTDGKTVYEAKFVRDPDEGQIVGVGDTSDYPYWLQTADYAYMEVGYNPPTTTEGTRIDGNYGDYDLLPNEVEVHLSTTIDTYLMGPMLYAFNIIDNPSMDIEMHAVSRSDFDKEEIFRHDEYLDL